MSDAEARRMQRGAFLPVLLILPMAAMFGFDQSKSQPMHFLMVFSVALALAAAIVAISWHGAKRRIDGFSRTTLELGEVSLIWESALGRSELEYCNIGEVAVQKVRGSVQSILLVRSDGTRVTLAGYALMELLTERLAERVSCKFSTTNSWLNF